MDRLKICFLIPSFKGGGAEKQCALLINGLIKFSDFKIHLIYFEEGVNFKMISQNGLTLHKLPFSSYYSPLNIYRLTRVIKRIRPEILFSWLPISDIYAYFVKKMFSNIKWAAAERDSSYADNLRNNLRNKLVLKADLILTNSESGREFWVKRGKKKDDVIRMSNIVDIQQPTGDNLLSGEPSVLYVGRFEPQKNVISLLNATVNAISENKEIKLYCIGKGSLKDQMIDIVNSNLMQQNVIIMDYKKDIQNYFKSADIFISLSHHEGTPNTLLESIYLGIAPIVSDIPEHREVLGPDYPYFVNIDNDDFQLNTLINNVLSDENVNEKLEYARNILSEMTGERVALAYTAAFDKLLT